MKVNEYNQMMAYMLRPRQKFAIGGGVIEGENLGSREGFAKPIQLTWEKVTEDPLFEQFWKEEIDIANDPSKNPKKYKTSEIFYKDLKKVIDKYKTTNPEKVWMNLVKETNDTESIMKRPNIEKNIGRKALLNNRSHPSNSLRKFNKVFKTDVSPTGQKLLSIDEFAEKIGYTEKQLAKVLAGRFLDMPDPKERFTTKGINQVATIQLYNKLKKALDDAGIKVTYPKDLERIEREGSRGATGTMRRGAGKIRIEANPEQIKNFKLPFAKKDIFSGEMTTRKLKDIYTSLSIESDEYKKFGYSRDRTAVQSLKAALNNSLRAMSKDELVAFIKQNPKLKHIVEMSFNPKTLKFERIPVEDLAKSGTLTNFQKQGFFEVDHIRGRATVDYDPATKKILDGLNIEYPKNLTIIPKGLNLSTKQLVENFVANDPNNPAVKNIDKTFKEAGLTYYDRANKKYRGADPSRSAVGLSHLGLEEDLEKILLNKKTFIDSSGVERVVIDDGERLLANIKELNKIRFKGSKVGGRAGTLLSIAGGLVVGLPVAYGAGKELIEGRNPFSMSAQAAETGQLPQGSPAQINQIDEGFTNTEKLLAGTTAGAAFAARKPLLRTLGKVIRPFGFPSVAAGFAAGELLSDDPNLGIAGAELLAPELIKQTGVRGILANPFQLAEKASRFGKIGRGIASLARAPAMFTPIGLGLMGIEGIRMGMREQDRINLMRETDPEAYQEYLAEQEDLLGESA